MTREAVVDASVAACWLIPDEQGAAALALLDAMLEGQIRVMAPELWRYEMLNVVRNAVSSSRLDEHETRRALALLAEAPVEFVPAGPQRQAAMLTTALDHKLSIYDAAYFALAQEVGVPLVTKDKDLLKLRRRFSWICTVDHFLEGLTR